jgi:hypothetical protein
LPDAAYRSIPGHLAPSNFHLASCFEAKTGERSYQIGAG